MPLYPTIFFRHRKSLTSLANVLAFTSHGYGIVLLQSYSRLGVAASAEKSGQNSNESVLLRAISCNSASVPRIALQRPHRTRTVAGECAGSSTLIERPPQSSQTTLNRDRCRVAVSSIPAMAMTVTLCDDGRKISDVPRLPAKAVGCFTDRRPEPIQCDCRMRDVAALNVGPVQDVHAAFENDRGKRRRRENKTHKYDCSDDHLSPRPLLDRDLNKPKFLKLRSWRTPQLNDRVRES
jgi:hypothetical protein